MFSVLFDRCIETAVEAEDGRWIASGGLDVSDGQFLGRQVATRYKDNKPYFYFLRSGYVYNYDYQMNPLGYVCAASEMEAFGFKADGNESE